MLAVATASSVLSLAGRDLPRFVIPLLISILQHGSEATSQ